MRMLYILSLSSFIAISFHFFCHSAVLGQRRITCSLSSCHCQLHLGVLCLLQNMQFSLILMALIERFSIIESRFLKAVSMISGIPSSLFIVLWIRLVEFSAFSTLNRRAFLTFDFIWKSFLRTRHSIESSLVA